MYLDVEDESWLRRARRVYTTILCDGEAVRDCVYADDVDGTAWVLRRTYDGESVESDGGFCAAHDFVNGQIEIVFHIYTHEKRYCAHCDHWLRPTGVREERYQREAGEVCATCYHNPPRDIWRQLEGLFNSSVVNSINRG